MLAGEVGREIADAQNGWRRLEILTNFFPPRTGWVLMQSETGTLLREVQAPPRQDFTLWSFLKAAVESEIRFNEANVGSNFFIVADFLIAWADIASKLKNIGQKDPRSDGTGPFQISSDDWAAFCASSLGRDFVTEDRDDGLAQMSGAAFLALEAIKRISDAVANHDDQQGDPETSGDTGPYIPSYVDILLAVLFSVPFAIDIRLAKLDNEGGSSIEPLLAEHFPNVLARLAVYRQDLLKTAGGSGNAFETVDGLLLAAEKMLAASLTRAFKLISENIPEDLPKTDGTAPWHSVATAEDADWTNSRIANDQQAMKKRIGLYLTATGLSASPILPWCGAFATFCMKGGGEPFSETVVRKPARAANWASWGNMSIPLGQREVPPGAVVVLAPEKGSARSGHVGFFERYFEADPTVVEILGGNQGGKVTRTKFARSKIVAIRWLSPVAVRETFEADESLSSYDPQRLLPLLDLIGLLESGNNYNAFFGNSRNSDSPKFVTMTVADVIEWQRRFVADGRPSSAVGRFQFLRKTLKGLRDDGLIKSSAVFNQTAQDNLGAALIKRRGLGRLLAGSLSAEDFAVNLAKEWAALPVPKDVRNGSRMVRAGESYYAGDNNNRALVSVAGFMHAVRSILD
ncbi:hypothetical protein EHS39_23525 [Ensifer sp. MPMI2T]|nr:hypothetical protein EHS39_23525 [Ensifer sp. MPMI2T]